MVFFGREIESAAHITADGAEDFGATLFLAGRLNDTHVGMVTGGVYNVVLVREAVILIALVHRVAVLCASRRDNGNGEGVLCGENLFGRSSVTVLAMQSPDAILIIGGLRGDSAFVPDMTRATVGVSHGMRSVTLAVHQHSALFGAGSLFQTLGICKVPIMAADSWHRLQHSFVAPLVVAVHPTLALGLTRRLLHDFAKARVIVGMYLDDIFGLCCTTNSAGKGLDASLSSGRLLRYNAFTPLMLAGSRKVTHMLLIVAALTDIVYAARSATGSGSSDFLILMAQRSNRCILIGLCGILIAGMQRVTVLGAGRSDHSFREGIAQFRNYFLMNMGLVILTGIGALTVFFVGRFLRYNAFVPRVSRRRNRFRVGVAPIILAGKGLDTVLGAGRSLGDSTIIPLMAQSRDFLGLSLIAAITSAGIGLNASCRTGRCRCDCTGIPGMPQCIRIIAFFGQSGILVADINGIALFCAGRLYRSALMPCLLDYRDILRVSSTAGGAGKGLRTLLVDGSRLCDLTGIVGVRQLCLVIALISKTGDFVALMKSGSEDAVRMFLNKFMEDVRASLLFNTSGIEPLYAVSHVCQFAEDNRMHWPHIHVLWGIKRKIS